MRSNWGGPSPAEGKPNCPELLTAARLTRRTDIAHKVAMKRNLPSHAAGLCGITIISS